MSPGRFSNYIESGSAGISALLFMLLLGVIGGAYVAITSSELNTAASYRDGVAAQYLAEAGVQHALVKLKTNEDGFINKTNTLNKTSENTFKSSIKNSTASTAGSYTVTVTGSGNTRTITSIGTVNKAKRQLVVTVNPGSLDESDSVFKYAAFSGNKMTINSGATINGDVGTWHPSIHQNGGTINGDIYLKVRDDSKFQDFPSFKSKDYSDGNTTLQGNLDNKTYNLSGTYYIDSGLNMNQAIFTTNPDSSAVIYVKGGANLGGTISGNVTIIANGGVNINSGSYTNVKIYADGGVNINASIRNSLVMATNDINVNSGDSKAVLYAQKDINYNSGVTTGGSVVAGHELIINGGVINYDSNVIKTVVGTASGFSIITWNNK